MLEDCCLAMTDHTGSTEALGKNVTLCQLMNGKTIHQPGRRRVG